MNDNDFDFASAVPEAYSHIMGMRITETSTEGIIDFECPDGFRQVGIIEIDTRV